MLKRSLVTAVTMGVSVAMLQSRLCADGTAIGIDLQVVAEGLTAPVYLTHAGDGSGRLFILDQVGQIRIVKNGQLLPTPFLDLTGKVIAVNAFFDERGLLGLAFHPDYLNNGRFFVRYSIPRAGNPNEGCNDPNGFIVGCHEEILAEYHVLGSPATSDVANPGSQQILFRVDEPEFNHNSGQVLFGPDGLLYFTLGDGGGANDDLDQNGRCDAGHCLGNNAVCSASAQNCVDLTKCVSDLRTCTVSLGLCGDGSACVATGTTPHGPIGNGQNRFTTLGSVLRIDVGAGAVLPDQFPGDPNRNYAIPPGNPFAGGGGAPEIYAYGMRNPYRFSFDDRFGGDGRLYVADVGQNIYEELDVLPVLPAPGLLNYGWVIKEGFACFDPFDPGNPPASCSSTGPLGEPLLDPALAYDHSQGIAIIGGFVYRGSDNGVLIGKYVFGDFSLGFFNPAGRLFYTDISGKDAFELRDFIVSPLGNPIGKFLFGIGQDEDGELYVCTSDNLGPVGNTGIVYRIVNAREVIPVPTVSAWGLTMIGLVMLVVAKVCFARRGSRRAA